MFDKFGEFNSVEELNEAAAGFKREGDLESLKELAIENGLDEDDAQDYIDGLSDELATLPVAAFGKLDMEEKQVSKAGLAERMAIGVILNMTRTMCDTEEMQRAVLHKGKRAEKLLSAMRNAAQRHKEGNVGVACGTDKQLRGLIKAYYLQNEEDLQKELEKLYV